MAQHLEALAVANQNRVARAKLRRDLHAHPDSSEAKQAVAEVLIDPPPYIDTMSVVKLIVSGNRIHRKCALNALRAAGATELATVGGLTQRQRERIAEFLLDSRKRKC